MEAKKQNNMKQQPQHRDLTYETTTKQQQKEVNRKPKPGNSKQQKGKIRKKGLPKQQPKNL